jgi:OmcA/MtrC family decaheme c-type cytochrome
VGEDGPTGAELRSGICMNCHGDVANSTATVDNTEVHLAGAPLRRHLGERFALEILDAQDTAPGQTPSVRIRVTDPRDGSAYDLLEGPEFNPLFGASMDLYLAWTTADIYNGDRQGSSLGGRSDEEQPRGNGHPLRMVLEDIQAVAVREPDGSYRVPFYTALPGDFAGDPVIGLAGHPLVDFERAAPTSAVFHPGSERAPLVALERCNACHEHLQAHGAEHNDDLRICIACHNADAVDDRPGEGAGPLAFGVMVHNIHAAKGVFSAVTYPRGLADCEACHQPGTYNTARATARAVSEVPNDPALWSDDYFTTPSSAVCSVCHGDTAAHNHMLLNGGVFNDGMTGKAALGSVPRGQEACPVCHGPGRSTDTALAHGLGD